MPRDVGKQIDNMVKGLLKFGKLPLTSQVRAIRRLYDEDPYTAKRLLRELNLVGDEDLNVKEDAPCRR
ncbi:MAG: hypothetical protein ACRDQZ_11840 [Mycobacteriales bacterium]